MPYAIDDLGVQCTGDSMRTFYLARDPRSGEEVALVALSLGGFLVVDPRTGTSRQILPERPFNSGWAIGQGPDGAIYQAGFHPKDVTPALQRWDWEGNTSHPVTDIPCRTIFSLDIAPDGRVYFPDYQQNHLYRHDPLQGGYEDLGEFDQFGDHFYRVHCGQDGLVYAVISDYKTPVILVIDPSTGERTVVSPSAPATPADWLPHEIVRDAVGHVLVPVNREGIKRWYELADGQCVPIDPSDVRLTEDGTPLVFSDGSYIRKITDDNQALTVTYVDVKDATHTFIVTRDNAPLRIFSLTAGGGKIWGGTFIPLTLFSYDPATEASTWYGNPTRVTGEIYNMVYSQDKLYLASYTEAVLTRYTPQLPWRGDAPNPVELGMMKEEGLPLQRPRGKALAPDGTVFFSAIGDYGCPDSGISRINPTTDEVTRWVYADTMFGAVTYLSSTDRLLVSERRQHEQGLRFTFISPQTGEILASSTMIDDAGDVVSWLHDGDDLVYGLHSWRATLFAYSISRGKIVANLSEMRVGEHCYNALLFGPDARIWGLTNRCVYAVLRDLSGVDIIGDYPDYANGNSYRFGICYGPDGHIYFPNGTHLMRVRQEHAGSASS